MKAAQKKEGEKKPQLTLSRRYNRSKLQMEMEQTRPLVFRPIVNKLSSKLVQTRGARRRPRAERNSSLDQEIAESCTFHPSVGVFDAEKKKKKWTPRLQKKRSFLRKPVSAAEASCFARIAAMERKADMVKHTLHMKRVQCETDALKECTFHPKTLCSSKAAKTITLLPLPDPGEWEAHAKELENGAETKRISLEEDSVGKRFKGPSSETTLLMHFLEGERRRILKQAPGQYGSAKHDARKLGAMPYAFDLVSEKRATPRLAYTTAPPPPSFSSYCSGFSSNARAKPRLVRVCGKPRTYMEIHGGEGEANERQTKVKTRARIKGGVDAGIFKTPEPQLRRRTARPHSAVPGATTAAAWTDWRKQPPQSARGPHREPYVEATSLYLSSPALAR
jgi:hypothetical protein